LGKKRPCSSCGDQRVQERPLQPSSEIPSLNLTQSAGDPALGALTGRGTRRPWASLGLEHRLHSPCEKSLIERSNEYLKGRIEEFDDYYPCTKAGCDLSHARNRLNLFVDVRYARRMRMGFGGLVRFLGGDAP
jgi:hypothetical protein